MPTFDGIIVCEDQVALLTEAYTAWAQKQVEAARRKKERKVVARWAALTRGVLTRDRVRREWAK